MIYREFTVESAEAIGVEAEITFAVARSKAEGTPLILLHLDFATALVTKQKNLSAFAKSLVSDLRKQGYVQAFITEKEYGGTGTAYAYLANKYPDIEKDESLQTPALPYLLIKVD